MDLRQIFDPFHNSKETPFERHNARELLDWAEREAARIGLSEPPVFLRVHHDLPNAGACWAEIDGIKKPIVVLTDGELKVFNSPNLNKHMPDGLKAVIGHEMSHLNDIAKGVDGIPLRKLPMFALPLLSLAGYELYKYAKKRHQEDPEKTARQHLDDITEEEKQKSKKYDEKWHEAWEGPMIEWSRRIAVMAGGLLVGGMIARHMSLSSEFRADRAAVVAAGGNPEVVIEAMTRAQKAATEWIAPQLKQWGETMSSRGFMENVKQIYEVLKHDLRATFHHAHPSDLERFKAMRKFARDSGFVTHQI